jgi:hypothetical protein
MAIHKINQSNSDMKFNLKSGEKHTITLESIQLIFDDPVTGFLKNKKVSLTHEDGQLDDVQTDDKGFILIKRGHGKFVDAEICWETGTQTRRIFVFLDPANTSEGAWQRLVNMGYVQTLQPSMSQGNPEELAMSLEIVLCLA